MDGIVELESAQYPEALKAINDPPERLFFKGVWDSGLFNNCLAVVGSRRMTRYGAQITDLLISQLAAAGITIVSGFMYGIDARAHQAAVTSGGRTIAVMPCGIERIYPQYQERLYHEIIENDGLIISEYVGDYPPLLWTFPKRNRIIAGLSLAVMVVEAGPKSGALITANLAKKYQRRVFVVAGQINVALFSGIKQLIKDGADIVTEAGDVLSYYGIKQKGSDRIASPEKELQGLEALIAKELSCEPLEIDVLSRRLRVSAAELGTAISLMELKGILVQTAGKYYVN